MVHNSRYAPDRTFRIAAPNQGKTRLAPRNPDDLRRLGDSAAGRLVPCPECSAPAKSNCVTVSGLEVSPHRARIRIARRWINVLEEPMASVIAPQVAEEVIARADGYCEACGGPLAGWRTAMHHRKPRKHGDHSAANLMLVHGDFNVNCHNLHQGSIHANPKRSHRLGHILYENEVPADVKVVVVRNLLELRA